MSVPSDDRTSAPAPQTSGLELPAPPPAEAVDATIDRALAEDALADDPLARGPRPAPGDYLDLTSRYGIPPEVRARGRLVAKSAGRLAGLGVFARVFERLDPQARVELLARDGEAFEPGRTLCAVEGHARALLLGERTALNLIQRLCGTATMAARYVEVVRGAGADARVLDTRKTTPGLRELEKYAVRCGGATNHRMGLHDEAMVKNNHADLAGRPLVEVVRAIRAGVGPGIVITCEARDQAEALAGVEGGADVVMLDNMPPATMAELAPRLRAAAGGRPLELEASGGITLDNLAEVARSGVDRISIGALTHSAPALDLSFYLAPLGRGAT